VLTHQIFHKVLWALFRHLAVWSAGKDKCFM